MRLVPLNSPYFTITRGVSNHPEGLIAPGMHVTCTVTFTPPSLCNYQEEIKVQSDSGYCLTIPVLAVRPAPCLSLPEVIECGSCLAGGRMDVDLEVKNSGGEGRFSVRATTHHQHHQQSPTQSEGVLILGPFTVSPTEFHLPPLHSTTLQVTFSPAAEGQYGEQFVIECDNGETLSFSLTGSGDVVSVGCVSIGDSSLQEISQFTSDGNDADRSNQRGVDPVMSAVDYDLYTEQLEECSVVFDVVNPRSPAYKTVVIRNYCGVELPFCWKLFRPITELSSSGEEDPVLDDLVPSVNSPFSVLPPSGTLPAASTHTFLCQFLPHKPGQYVDGCHLVLSQVPEVSLDLSLEGEAWRRMGGDDSTSTCTVSPVCLFLSGVAQPYVLELEPPALLIPVAVPLATDVRRRVKLVNRSVSRLHYCWREPLLDEGITISPVSGSLVGGGGGGYCEVVIRRSVAGEFALNLICDIEHSTHPVTLPLHGWTQGPQVSVDCASLEFGLVPLGTSSQLTLTLTSHTHTSLPILLRQAIGTQATLPSTSRTGCRDSETDVTDHECIHFTPSSLTLPPHTVTTLTVECRPLVTGRLRSTVRCLVDDQVIRCLAVHAEVQSPRVVLTECVVHQDTAYVGVGCERRVQMTNTSLIPTLFSWRQQVEGESRAHCSVSISPSSGSIGPRQSLPVTITATWDSTGSHPEAILCCDVEGMSEPLLLVLSAEVHGLAVSYSVQEKRRGSSDEEELRLEFGSEVSLFTPHTLHLLVTNTTAIPTTLSTSLSSFPPSHPHLPTPPPPPPHRSRKKSLLSRTVNIGDPKSKTSQQANKDYMSGLLQEGRGCCFVVDPPTSTLLPFTTHTLTVTAYADMWGDYHDTLSCQVSGLEAVEYQSIVVSPVVHSCSTALHSHNVASSGLAVIWPMALQPRELSASTIQDLKRCVWTGRCSVSLGRTRVASWWTSLPP
ncbi:Deleted in lung and esophageal cancer protein 1 [Geodia barretti]|uniref:Deleted in lung and esophageal cancer protein 1 n=1 Tax=Geodia barretti TaxID=519541 RepID=A0AA35WAM6_GEOBA|nr:Deleted in lung and esophageal cancer protein 1 [Geodia barretti]